jgi:raffinose/stachyose/melibiose transport system substrate-binding protein
MNKTIRLTIYTLIIASMVLAAAGCASGSTPQATQPQKLTIWINGRDSFIGPNEQQLPQDQWYISQAIKRFEDANPGVTIELVTQADAFAAHQMFRTAGLAGNAPDIANLWSGQFTFAVQDVIKPINDLIPEADKQNLLGWDTVTSDFKAGNPILGYPTPDNQMCIFLYNKKIMQEVGLDYENNPPRTMDAFYADMEKIKNAGYIPIAVDEAVDGYPYYFFQVAAYWWVQQNGIEPILAEDRGEANFADDQALLTALEAYQNIYAKGYMNEDAATSSDSWNKFLHEISDTAKIKNGTIGGPGQDMVIAKNSTNPELAVKFMSFLNSKDEVLKLNEFQTKVPIRKDVTEADLGLKPGSIGSKLIEWSKNYVFWVDNSLSAPVVDDFSKLLPLVLTGKMTPLELAQQLDKDKGNK